ncbi:uncharacterized protein DS421_11g319640 [Arachis hypogaea]|nr:uncharacterized protein DS421_11g319640 [Arachis hypogaea]
MIETLMAAKRRLFHGGMGFKGADSIPMTWFGHENFRPWNWGDRFLLLLWWLLFQWMIGFGGNLGVGSSGIDCLIQPFFFAVETKWKF